MSSGMTNAGLRTDTDALKIRVDELQRRMLAGGDARTDLERRTEKKLQDIEERLKALEDMHPVGHGAKRVQDVAIEKRVETVEAMVQATDGRLTLLHLAVGKDIPGMKERLEALERAHPTVASHIHGEWLGSSALKWTQEVPRGPGYYWSRFLDRRTTPWAFYLSDPVLEILRTDAKEREWYGPIEPPE